jgi:hypothetical protein
LRREGRVIVRIITFERTSTLNGDSLDVPSTMGFQAMTSTPSQSDPVRLRRAVIARWTARANRAGYGAFGVSIAAVTYGLIADFTPMIGRLATGGLIVGSILLAPAIVLGYAIKAAERDDRERGI